MDQLGSDMVVEPDFEEKQHVAIITNDADDTMDEADDVEPEPRADEYDAFFKKHMPELVDQETEAEACHTWEIRDWRTLTRREHGPVFECGGHPWRILFFPYGNNVDFASFYLEQGYEEKKVPEDWYACVQFMLVLWNPNDPTMFITHTATHRFTAEEGDWGFTRFAELRRLFSASWDDRARPMVENNAANVTAYVRVLKDPTGVLWHNFINYDSKKETGMVGLKNQGATCYLNSLLQSLFFTNAFRKAVYQIPTEKEESRTDSAFALQRLFYLLQTSNTAVATTDLTQSFGWDSKQIFEQQDVQELSRVLMDKLDDKMKGTEAQGALEKMFVGKMKTYISCINVDYESSRTEDFWDIQLNVSGNKNLDDSFKDYIQVETMEGDNKYHAEGHGLQDARKGVIFESFPQVLHLQLKRFEYDIQRDAMMKVNDRYEFPEIWDASPYLSETADRDESWIYHLHGVLVHSGDLNAGHYYAFLKPEKEGHFYKFDDDRVTRATNREALEENFGGDYTQANGNIGQRNPYTRTWSAKRSMSAYMLVYIRESRLDDMLMPGKEVNAPQHLADRIAEERAAFERRRKEREEAHLYMDIAVASDDQFKVYQGFDIVPWKGDNESPASPKIYRVLKATTVLEFMETVAEELGIEADLLRPWAMVNRQNGTVRPDVPVQFLEMTVEVASQKFGTKTTPFRLWIEKAGNRDEDGKAIFGTEVIDAKNNQQGGKVLMLFLKHFDTKTQSLFGIGNFYASIQDKVSDLGPQICNIMGWPPSTPFKLSEEIKQNMIEGMKPKMTLAQSEIQDGDIITVQRTLPDKELNQIAASGGYADAKDFYDYLLNRINVEFSPRFGDSTQLPTFSLTLSKKMTYEQFASKVAEHLKIEPTHIRFTTVNTAGKPKIPVKYSQQSTLNNILFPGPYNYAGSTVQRTDQLFYEVLEMSLKELEQRKAMRITWLPEGLTKEDDYTLMIPRNADVSELLDALQQKAGISDEVMKKVRVYEAHNNKFYKSLSLDFQIMGIGEYLQLYAAAFPEDESSKKVTVFHFDKEVTKIHGIPFQFSLKEGEVFSDTKQRLSDFTKIKGKQFDKIKFCLVSRSTYSRPESIEDDEILWDLIGNRDDISIGFDHANKSRSFWGKSDSIFIR
ncbi:ubiquitin-specific protease ubp15 [Kalmusia sp. IMI 367209]|nr:ubiquitin-specific protease ubp15 [Kalmusia sp. IMI 367209]